ncbi:ATP-binding protein [Clostridium estertheticum]|uniref:ATP-binding protein n=1 Tax=Clostridium estertheticum TaxID=238834 RepID=A0A7Y3SZP0_9CLOT|nr:DUF87 domain-containing protein [Clostridium estertheticum]NNU78351.1 ATP-binding protein [Clostridium estertheticum]WBL45295.1 DUF87 domain-containing protein [Clostridium estertheticum]
MDEMMKIMDIKRINQNVVLKNIQDRDVDFEDYSFYCIDKLVLANQLKIEDRYEFISEAMFRFIQAVKVFNTTVIYAIKSNAEDNKIAVYIGINKKNLDIAESLKVFFQNVEYHKVASEDGLKGFDEQAIITGIPCESIENIPKLYDSISPLVKYCKGKNILIQIVGRPMGLNYIQKQIQLLLEEKTKNSENIKKTNTESIAKNNTLSTTRSNTTTAGENNGAGFVLSTGSNTSTAKTDTESNTSGETETTGNNKEKTSAFAWNLDHFLEEYVKRFIDTLSSGLWKTCISISSDNEEAMRTACGIFISGKNKEALEPFKMSILEGKQDIVSLINNKENDKVFDIFQEENAAFSYLTGKEASLFFDLPKEECYGYDIRHLPRFSQNVKSTSQQLSLGSIYDGDVKTNINFGLSEDVFSKHLLIAGATGSGKTNTIFNIVKKIKVPFLVIEPAKKEYRGLNAIIPNLRVYSLGDETISPFRFNPFYFGKDINIQQHIDNIKVIFNATFSMYASMPNILEQCLNMIYIKKGWSLTTSENIYAKGVMINEGYYPTIEDLYYEIDSYTKKLGYAEEQTQNIRAALLTRIKSLMTGGKGFMLNTNQKLEMDELLKYPTILELDKVADDDEKSLIIGLIVMNIYEHLKNTVTEYSGKLKHILIFEEAHRIFTNVSQNQNQETANIKGKAVENLSNILCEVRAYGEGMIIIDQVPIKLAPDVLKNTNTKIIHRLVSREDGDYVADSLGLENEDIGYLNKLKNGSALIFSEGMQYPVHVQLELQKDDVKFIPDIEMKNFARKYNPLVENPKNIHPLTEQIMQQNPLPNKIIEIGRILYDNLTKGELKENKKYYISAGIKFIDFAYNEGFDINIKRDVFVRSIVEESLYSCIKTDKDLEYNINKKICIKRYVQACIEIIDKEYSKNEKEYQLLEFRKRKLFRSEVKLC